MANNTGITNSTNGFELVMSFFIIVLIVMLFDFDDTNEQHIFYLLKTIRPTASNYR